MKYKIEIEPTAQRDIQIAYNWGKEKWGLKQANKWNRELIKAVMSLGSFPERYALAPENDELKIEVRQKVFQRYRILYSIKNNIVGVLHLRGAYTEEQPIEEDSE